MPLVVLGGLLRRTVGTPGAFAQPLEVLGFCRLPRHLPVKSVTGEAPLARQGSPDKSLMRLKERGWGRGEDGRSRGEI